MSSKYEHLLPGLPVLPPQDAGYQQKVQDFKNRIINDTTLDKSPSKLAKAYALARAKKEVIEAELSEINLYIEGYTQMLIESQNSNDAEWGTFGAAKNTLRLVTGDKIEVRKEPYASVEDREANRKWAIANGLENLLSLSWQTVNSHTKDRLLKGEPEPDGVKVFMKPKIVFTRMKQDD